MADRTPPPPPPTGERGKPTEQAPIADMREHFARKTPQTDDDRARTRAFIAGKIDMIRADRTMTEAEKQAAIADLESRRD